MSESTLRDAIDQHQLREMRDLLCQYRSRGTNTLTDNFWQSSSDLKEQAVSAGDQMTAKAIWCLETIGSVQNNFVSVFRKLLSGEFQEAWNLLERCENEIGFLDAHFSEEGNEFGVEHIRVHTKQLQELYPLTVAASPAFLHKDVRCSICDARLTLRKVCEHTNGEIYDGKMCVRIIKSSELLHIALVTNPVQKFSFIFPEGDISRALRPIKDLAIALGSPWRQWRYHKEERRQSHPAFRGVGRNDPCPCGSGAKYKRCCSREERVFPHFFIELGGEVPVESARIRNNAWSTLTN